MKQIFTSKLFGAYFQGQLHILCMLSRDADYPRLILDGDELYLKISPKGLLNSRMSSAQPSERKEKKKAHPGENVWHSGIESSFQRLQNNKP